MNHLRLGLTVLRHRGLRHAYNRWWVSTFYNNFTLLRRVLYQRFYPLIGYDPFPSGVEIEVSTLCNLKCVICEHTYWDEPSRALSFEDFKMIIDQFPKIRYFAPSGIGENLMNKDLVSMLRYVRSKWRYTYMEFIDNFHYLDETIARELMEIGIDNILASIDGATKETYEKIRVGADFDRVIRNVKRLIEIRNEMGMKYCEVRFHYIINSVNLHEVVPFVGLAKQLGCDSVFFTQILHGFPEINHLAVEVPESVIKSAEAKAAELGIRIYWNLNTAREKPPVCLCSQWIVPFVYVTGHMLPCCAMQEANTRDFQKENSFGNFFGSSFRDIWYSDKFKTFRQTLRKGEVPSLCRDCPVFETGNNGIKKIPLKENVS